MNTRISALVYSVSVLACTHAAAQSNVSVYGIMDLNAGHLSNVTGHEDAFRVNSGGMNTSRLGFIGSEDIGGGMKAVFQLEMGIAADTGTADTPLFKRQATVGLEGRYGTLLLGRAFNTVYDFMLPYDPMGYAPAWSWAPTGNASGASKYGMAMAFDNMIKYTGKSGNFTYGASVGAGEQASSSDGAKGAVAVNYAHGPFSVVATWERLNGLIAPAQRARDEITSWHAGVMYNHGKMKLQAAVRDYRLEPGSAGTPAVRARLYWAGGNYVVTPLTTLALAVYYQDVRNVIPSADADPVMLVARARHALSRRTDVYLAVARARSRHGLPVSLARDEIGQAASQRGIIAGIQHRF